MLSDTTRPPSPLKHTDVAVWLWPSSVSTHSPVPVSHTRHVLSMLPDITRPHDSLVRFGVHPDGVATAGGTGEADGGFSSGTFLTALVRRQV